MSSAADDLREAVNRYSTDHPAAGRWARGCGRIRHGVETQARVFAMAAALELRGDTGDAPLFEILHAADRVASASMWLVVHETYARRVYLDGRPLEPHDFKLHPEGHTGGALNMVPAYVGYLAANAITGFTRSWLMGQGHCVAAIDSVNLLVGNLTPAHADRYSVTDEGLTRYVRDFYSYRLDETGAQDSPLGSHVNAHTAGGIAEGGYLGFAELQYVHMPLPGERLVAFLSDGAFEEQRGSDWAPRWWRAEDCGLVAPIMIKNGRRIDQRTTMAQSGGTDWFTRHLALNGFEPIVFDGRDPAAFAWAMLEIEQRLEVAGAAARGGGVYPVALPYGVAVAPKGAGFHGEGTNLAHNLPLPGNPRSDAESARLFNDSASVLFVSADELSVASSTLARHDTTRRARERDHPLAQRAVELPVVPEPELRVVPDERRDPTGWSRSSPMVALDGTFAAVVAANPQLRARVGNPDEMRSNRMIRTLDALKFRVTDPEPGIPESVLGGVVTALNEEAVISAALANKGGINIAVTYEAFGAKMHGALRQEIIFAKQCADAGRPPRWLSIPLVLTSHTWENAKNEQSHQDPAMAESMLGESSDVSRVVFVPDANCAAAALGNVFQTRGELWTLVVPKNPVPDLFTDVEARQLLADGAMRIDWAGHDIARRQLILTAVGAYQLEQVLRASRRLAARDTAHSVVYLLEPGRYRVARNDAEKAHNAPEPLRDELYPPDIAARIFVTHTRPEVLLGTVQPLNTGASSVGLGYTNHGGTLTVEGLLYVNRSSWAHVVAAAARLLDRPATDLLDPAELEALNGRRSPEGVIVDAPPGDENDE
ncbi:MAG: xylulose 5-phosphate 3-epimerase [Acidimicrobiia bacterium]